MAIGKLAPSGPSEEGWSKAEAWNTCNQLYGYGQFLGIARSSKEAQARGLAIHQVIGQHYLRVKARQEGTDPDEWVPPERAVTTAIARGEMEPECMKWNDLAMTIYNVNFDPEQVAGPIVLGVEVPLGMTCGVLDVPGHPQDGQPIVYEPRIDLLEQYKDGKVYATDFKSASNYGIDTVEGYSMSGQFHGMQVLLDLHYGEAAGTSLLAVVESTAPFKIQRPRLIAAPAAVKRFVARHVYRVHERARVELAVARGELDPWALPATTVAHMCRHRYGRCHYYDLCARGPAALKPAEKERLKGRKVQE